MSDKVILLVSSTTTDTAQEVGQRRVHDLLKSKKVAFSELDGSLSENKEKRDQLFSASGLRGKYPQVFIESSSGDIKFVGGYDKMVELAESDSLDSSLLEANPSIETFTKTFGSVSKE